MHKINTENSLNNPYLSLSTDPIPNTCCYGIGRKNHPCSGSVRWEWINPLSEHFLFNPCNYLAAKVNRWGIALGSLMIGWGRYRENNYNRQVIMHDHKQEPSDNAKICGKVELAGVMLVVGSGIPVLADQYDNTKPRISEENTKDIKL